MRILVPLLAAVTLISSCADKQKGRGDITNMTIDQVEQDLDVVRKQRIYFGHKSVGYNIIEGIKGIISSSKAAPLDFVKVEDARLRPGPFFADSEIGKNGKPDTKCEAFAETIRKNFGDALDIALMKFCFVDVDEGTDVNAMFSNYKKTVTELQKMYPHITFIHVTLPLTTRSPAWKRFVKRIIGRKDASDLEAKKRTEFNSLLLQEYKNEAVFDLAGVEFTNTDGTRNSFEFEGMVVYSLIEEYTDDGGHLNALGRNLAGRELLHTLAQVGKSRTN